MKTMGRTGRSRALALALGLISLPLLLAFVEAGAYYAANRSNGTLVSSGRTRSYLLHVPRRYDHGRPTPLVISLHGASGWPAMQRAISGWDRMADEHGFLVVYPSGLGPAGLRVWRANQGSGRTIDVRFIADLIDTVAAAYTIDARRIYVDGLSNGAGMAFVLSCALPDRIAAVGMVASALLLDFDWCTEPRPVPLIAFHGTADPVTPYAGGKTWVAPRAFPDVPSFIAKWARRNGCASQAREAAVAPDVTRREYRECDANADVVFYTIEGGGHSWPGGAPLPHWFVGATSAAIDATRELWAFFQRHPLRNDSGR